jgi:hypothetical protein
MVTFKPLILLALSSLALAACDTGTTYSSGGGYNRNVLVVNNSGLTVTQFYGSNIGSTSWEEDILGANVLPAGSSVNVNFDDGSGYCTFDFKAVFADGSSVVENGIDVCATSQVTIN